MDCSRCITLENSRVRLRPLEPTDFEDLKRVIFDEELWKFSSLPSPKDALGLAAYLNKAVQDRGQNQRYAFAIIDRETGRVMGSTSYGSFSMPDRRLEIGWTWVGTEFQRTGINRAAKHLLLKYAFGELGCERVELKADALNLKSREAMQRMGATEEGILRSHMLLPTGRRRDSVYYSILRSEWDGLRQSVFREFDARG